MNILLITYFCVGFVVSDTSKVSVFGHCPYSVTVRIRLLSNIGLSLIDYVLFQKIYCRKYTEDIFAIDKEKYEILK